MIAKKLVGLFFVVLVVAGLGVGFQAYKRYTVKQEGIKKMAVLQTSLEETKQKMLSAYQLRFVTLEIWESEEKTQSKNKELALDLVIDEALKEAKTLSFQDEREAARYDFIQAQILEKIGNHMRARSSPKRLEEMQKIEQEINKERRAYLDIAKEITKTEQEYGLPSSNPVIFPSEKSQDTPF